MHHVCKTCGPNELAETLSATALDEFATWLEARAARGTIVRTMREVIGGETSPPVTAAPTPPPSTTGKLVQSGSMEVEGNGRSPDCWNMGFIGALAPQWSRTTDAHSGQWAALLQRTTATVLDRTIAMSRDSGRCSIPAVPREVLTVPAWYKATGPVAFAFYRRDERGFWRSWRSSKSLPAAATWSLGTFTSPPLPEDTAAIAATVYLVDAGSMTVDDVSIVR